MTFPIDRSPIAERTLLVESIVSHDSRARSKAGLPKSIASNEVVLFLSYNFADVPVGTTFDCCYDAVDESLVRWVTTAVVAVTQQLALRLDEIPHGWKTIAVLRFDPEIPDLIRELPVADGWVGTTKLLVSTRETWKARHVKRVHKGQVVQGLHELADIDGQRRVWLALPPAGAVSSFTEAVETTFTDSGLDLDLTAGRPAFGGEVDAMLTELRDAIRGIEDDGTSAMVEGPGMARVRALAAEILQAIERLEPDEARPLESDSPEDGVDSVRARTARDSPRGPHW